MQKEKTKRPLGVSIIGGLNFFVLGLAAIFLFGFSYLNLSSAAGEAVLEIVSEQFPDVDITVAQIKNALLLQVFISLFFCASGVGLLKSKAWAYKATLYLAFFAVLLGALTVLMNFAIIAKVIPQMVYPGILIFYFTNKKVEGYFKPAKGKINHEDL